MKELPMSLRKVPLRHRGRPGHDWKPVAEKMRAHYGRAVFVHSNGVTPQKIRDNARKSLDKILGGPGIVHSQIASNGVYFWME